MTNDSFVVDVRPGPTFDFSAPRLLFKMPANTISVRNSYVPSRDGQRFFVNVSLDTVVPGSASISAAAADAGASAGLRRGQSAEPWCVNRPNIIPPLLLQPVRALVRT